MIKQRSILLSLMAIITIGCKTNVQNKTSYFVGQIINPKEKSLRVFNGDKKVYESNIKNNKFHIKLKELKEGLYTFEHGEEFQYLYLTPNDSIVMRLNTWDFDESLVFSGQGANKNNFLINLFLQNEKDEKLFYKFYKLKEKEFISKTDSIININLKKYIDFKKNNSVSNKFDALAKTAIYFPIYSIKEKYVENYNYFHKKNKIKISENFYDYRKNIDINDTKFLNYFAFRNYIGHYLVNISNEIRAKDKSKQLSSIILKQINNKIKNEKLKNAMLHNAIINCLLDNSCYNKDKNEVKAIFYKNCTDNKKVSNVKTIEKSLKLLQKNTVFPNLKTINFKGDYQSFNKMKTNKNRVIYFWPKEANRIQYMAKRVHYLSKKHPNILFIGLDNQTNNLHWKNYVSKLNLTAKDQFQLVDTVQNKWFSNEIPRAIILNKSNVIQNDFTYLSHYKFEKMLGKLK